MTGASSGLGRAFAESLAARGHPLIAVARREERLRELAAWAEREHGVTTRIVVADLATEEGLAACRDAVDAAGPLDVAILNAGFGTSGAFAASGRERAGEMVRLNCLAVVDLAAHVLPGMVERGAGSPVQTARAVKRSRSALSGMTAHKCRCPMRPESVSSTGYPASVIASRYSLRAWRASGSSTSMASTSGATVMT